MKACGFGADPEVGFFVFEEGEDGVGADGWLELRASIVFAEVEEAFVGADPEVSA
jgi:hypothetical protein